MSTGAKVLIGAAIGLGAIFLLLIVVAAAVPVLLANSKKAEQADAASATSAPALWIAVNAGSDQIPYEDLGSETCALSPQLLRVFTASETLEILNLSDEVVALGELSPQESIGRLGGRETCFLHIRLSQGGLPAANGYTFRLPDGIPWDMVDRSSVSLPASFDEVVVEMTGIQYNGGSEIVYRGVVWVDDARR